MIVDCLGLIQMGTISLGQGSRWRIFRWGVIDVSIHMSSCFVCILVISDKYISLELGLSVTHVYTLCIPVYLIDPFSCLVCHFVVTCYSWVTTWLSLQISRIILLRCRALLPPFKHFGNSKFWFVASIIVDTRRLIHSYTRTILLSQSLVRHHGRK